MKSGVLLTLLIWAPLKRPWNNWLVLRAGRVALPLVHGRCAGSAWRWASSCCWPWWR
ncbi:MAG: hypothetical protein R3A10_08390 [Caldilineaceae bacterium]